MKQKVSMLQNLMNLRRYLIDELKVSMLQLHAPLSYICLVQQGDPIEDRCKEHMERGSVIDQLVYCIHSYREAAMSNDSKFDHIDVTEKQKVKNFLSSYFNLH